MNRYLILILSLFSFQHLICDHAENLSIKRYQLPDEHPIKQKLDEIFTKERVTLDEIQFLQAGFKPITPLRKDKIVIARHPHLQGYVIKTFLDKYPVNKSHDPDWLWLSRRCQLAKKIGHFIKKKHMRHFTVPKKWLYPLPVLALQNCETPQRLNALLIEEEMPLLSAEDNKKAWELISDEALDELSDIILHVGGQSYRPDNVWMTAENTFAFIDTEYPHLPPRYCELIPYLTEEKGHYWTLLMMSKLLSEAHSSLSR